MQMEGYSKNTFILLHLDLYEWLVLNFPSRGGRKVLRQAYSSGRCLAEGPPEALPDSLIARRVSSPPLGPQSSAEDSRLRHTLVPRVS